MIFLFIGFKWYRFKGFLNAFLKKPVRLITTLLVLLIGGSLSYYFIKTNTQEPFDKTIVKGKLNTDKLISNIFLTDQITGDTLATIPVKDNSFRIEYQKEITANTYFLFFGNYTRK